MSEGGRRHLVGTLTLSNPGMPVSTPMPPVMQAAAIAKRALLPCLSTHLGSACLAANAARVAAFAASIASCSRVGPFRCFGGGLGLGAGGTGSGCGRGLGRGCVRLKGWGIVPPP